MFFFVIEHICVFEVETHSFSQLVVRKYMISYETLPLCDSLLCSGAQVMVLLI